MISNYLNIVFWFLPCMFLCEACMLLLTSVKKYRVIAWFALHGMLGFLGIGMDIPILNDVNVFLVFYFAGYLYRKRTPCLKESTLKIIAMTSIVLYIISMTTYRYGMHGAERLAIDFAKHFGFQQGIALIKIVIWANSRFVVASLGVIAMIVNVFLIVKWGGYAFLNRCCLHT